MFSTPLSNKAGLYVMVSILSCVLAQECDLSIHPDLLFADCEPCVNWTLLLITQQQKSLILHTGACGVVKQQSEVLKQDFTDLLTKIRSLDTVVFVSGPLPTVRRGDERSSRLLMLNKWLKATCAAQSVNFIDNFNIFWECRHLF